MIVAVASGKGGTGKTLIATNLAQALGKDVQFVDCDVEEPNGHLFLKPEIRESRQAFVPVPRVDEAKCTGCGECARICRFSGIVIVGKSVLTFPELCHGCGGCVRVCPEGAVTETERPIGVVEIGRSGRLSFIQGRLRIGEAMSSRLIAKVRAFTACFAALVGYKVLADADVDAPNLFILLEPRIRERESFRAGYRARIRPDRCTACGDCRDLCRCQAIGANYVVDEMECEGCGVCAHFCPAEAVDLEEKECGEWFISDTRYGPLVHARLGIGEESSGKLVATVRHNARLVADERGFDLVIVDGPPGIGCPVISAITGANLVLIVTEPTLSGLHDMKRVSALAKHFAIPTVACINKYDLNPAVTKEITRYCQKSAIRLVGRVPYDPVVSRALVNKQLIVEHEDGAVSAEIRSLWGALSDMLFAGAQGAG